MINDNSLPTKSSLIKILKEHLFADYRLFDAKGLASVKERIILLIYIVHSVIERDI